VTLPLRFGAGVFMRVQWGTARDGTHQHICPAVFRVALRIGTEFEVSHLQPVMPARHPTAICNGFTCASRPCASEARKAADRLAVEAWNKRTLGFQGPAQHRRRWTTHSMPGTAIPKSVALAATRIRPARAARNHAAPFRFPPA
jgi:hypothetical protein